MSIKDKVVIAFRNLKAGGQMVKKMIFGMMFVVMILFSFLMIIQSYFAYKKSFNQKHVADCYYYTELKSQELTDDSIETILKQSKDLQNQYQASEVSILCTLLLRDHDNQLEAGNTKLILNNQIHQPTNYFFNNREICQDIQWDSSFISLALYREGMSVFADNITNEYEGNYLIGNYPNNPGEIMLDTHILEVYGVEDIDNLLGTTVSISCMNEETEEMILCDYTLTGIFQGDLLSARESLATSDNHLEHVYVNLWHEDIERFEILFGSIRYYFDNYLEYVQNYEGMNNILQLNLSEIYESDDLKVKLTGLGMEYCLLYWIMDHIGKLLLLVAIVIGLIITCSVFYIFQFYRDRNAHYFSMLQNIGMENRDRSWIFSIEMCVVMLLATILGIYLSILFLLLLNYMTKQVLNFPMIFDIKTAIIAILFSWLYFWFWLRVAMRRKC